MSRFVWLPSASFAMSLKRATERSSRGSWRAESITLAAGTETSKVAGLLAMAGLLATAIVAALKLVPPATRTLVGIPRPPSRTVSLTSRAICMVPTESIPTTSATRTRRIKHAQTTATTTLKKRAHNVHYHDGHRHVSNDKSLVSCTSATPSNNKLSANESGRNCTPENYHLDSFHIP
jgi:hypothetical protein